MTIAELIQLLIAFATCFAAVAAWFSALQSKKSVEEARKLRFDEFRPIIKGPERVEQDKDGISFDVVNGGRGDVCQLKVVKPKMVEMAHQTASPGERLRISIKGEPQVEELAQDRVIVLEYQDTFERRFRTDIPVGVSRAPEQSNRRYDFDIKRDFVQRELGLKGKSS